MGDIMKDILGSLLPEFSSEDLEKLKTGLNFIAINLYTSFYVQDCMYSACGPVDGNTRMEGFIGKSSIKNGIPIRESLMPYCLSFSTTLLIPTTLVPQMGGGKERISECIWKQRELCIFQFQHHLFFLLYNTMVLQKNHYGSLHKNKLTRKNRHECISIIEDGSSMPVKEASS
ncbi:PREDICTED: uncharacterized protein LOC109173383 isoform X2 [Ipomoea nil]|nr:PREDICTED: uncharacterized protein LOC109173383 isoform X2 [Ipomoea nil]XP_019178197.1 PREDICTED: uncharacterized protein LOC109173383 isoform X2 [Ipomoea nil]